MTTEAPDDVVDGEAVEVEDNTETAIVPLTEEETRLATMGGEQVAGTFALAVLTDEQFDARLKAMKVGQHRVREIQRSLMRDGVDYGVIPGTKNPTLLKPGAEVLSDVYQLRAEFITEREVGDGIDSPALRFTSTCYLHLGSLEGPRVGMGQGAANSHEPRYRWRQGQRICPNCNKPTIRRSKEEWGGGWYCSKRDDGCGTNYDKGDPAIEAQDVGQQENPDPHGLENTLLKMSEKRAHVDATIRTLAIAGLFTQDVEDLDGATAGERSGTPSPNSATTQRAPSRQAGASPVGGGAPASEGAIVTVEGEVDEKGVPDRVKEIDPPEWSGLDPNSTVAEARVKIAVKNGDRKTNHTAVVLGDDAYRLRDAGIEAGDTLRISGELHLVEWAKGKPKMRQLWHVTSIEQFVESPNADDGSDGYRWIIDAGAQPVLSPNADQPAVEVPTDADGPAYKALPIAKHAEDEIIDTALYIEAMERKTTKSNKPFLDMQLTDEFFRFPAAMAGADADEQKVDATYSVGEKVRIVGVWKGDVIVLTGITTP